MAIHLEDILHRYRQFRWVPKRRGYGLLVRFAERLRGEHRNLKIGVVHARQFNYRLHLDLNVYLQRQTYYFGSFEPKIFAFFCAALKTGDEVVDVGANIGVYSLLSAVLVGRQGTVTAFEPYSQFRQALDTNVALNGLANIDVCNLALSHQAGSMELFADRQSASFVGDPNDRTLCSEMVRVETLDGYCASKELAPRLIKIDVDGHDYQVLQGGSGLISKVNPLLCVEVSSDGAYSPTELFNLLDTQQYRVFHEDNCRRSLDRERFKELLDSRGVINVIALPNSERQLFW